MNKVLKLFNLGKTPMYGPKMGKFLDRIEPFLRFFGIYKFTYIQLGKSVYRLHSYSHADKHFAGRTEIKIRDRRTLNKTKYCGYTAGDGYTFECAHIKPSEVMLETYSETI